jgi:hypothetical protein
MPTKIDFDRLFAPLAEIVEWRQDGAKGLRGTFEAVVIHGESQSASAGASLDAVTADPWTVCVSEAVAIAAEIAIGDSLHLSSFGREVLTVQQITRDATGWIIRCTANMRASRG